MIGLQMPFQHPTLLLAGKVMENISEILAELTVKHFPSAFRYPHYMELAFPFRVA
jgi:hypothetical protein